MKCFNIYNILTLWVLSLLFPWAEPELVVKPPAPISGDPVMVEEEANLAQFSKESKSYDEG